MWRIRGDPPPARIVSERVEDDDTSMMTILGGR